MLKPENTWVCGSCGRHYSKLSVKYRNPEDDDDTETKICLMCRKNPINSAEDMLWSSVLRMMARGELTNAQQVKFLNDIIKLNVTGGKAGRRNGTTNLKERSDLASIIAANQAKK